MKRSMQKLLAMQLLILMAIAMPAMRLTYAETKNGKVQIISEPIFFHAGDVLTMSNGLELTLIDEEVAEESFEGILTLDEYIAARQRSNQADDDDDENAVAESSNVPPSPYRISLYSNEQPRMNEGDLLDMWAELDGFEDKDITLQWRYLDEDGEWDDIEGANSTHYKVPLTQRILSYGCCLVVTVD